MKVPASYHQERLWFIDRFEAGNLYESSPTYHNIPYILEINGPLDIWLLERSIQIVINRHEALRTRILTIDDRPVQLIEETMDFSLEVVDLCADGVHLEIEKVVELAVKEYRGAFLLDKDCLIQGRLYKVDGQKFVLVLIIHHAVADKYSLEILAREMLICYKAGKKNQPIPLAELTVQYSDFARWQREFSPKFLKPLLVYWKRKLRGKLQALELPTDRARALVHVFSDDRKSITFSKAVTDRIRDFAQQSGLSIFTILLAAFKLLLHKYSGLEEIIVGTNVKNRNQPEIEGVIGPISNLLVLRTHLSGIWSFDKLLRDVDRTVWESQRYQAMPFDRLVTELNPVKDMSRTALFDVLIQYEEDTLRLENIEDLEIDVIETNLGWGKYDLNLLIQDKGEDFTGILVYNSKYFDDQTISRLIAHYQVILGNVLADPNQKISEVGILTDEEKQWLLKEWSGRIRSAKYPLDITLDRLFQEQVAQRPDHVALVGPGLQPALRRANIHQLSYGALNRRSNQLARYVRAKGMAENDIAALFMEHSHEMVVGILGVLKAGGTYLPIDSKYPAQRISYMLADSCTKIVLTDRRTGRERIGGEIRFKGDNVYLDDSETYGEDALNLHQINSSNAAAYIIYTSGTTGNPKGVMVEHRNVVSLLFPEHFQFDFDHSDVWIIFHSYCFDFSVWEMYGALLYGARVIVSHGTLARNTGQFLQALKQYGVTVLNQTPSAFYYLMNEELKSPVQKEALRLKYVIFGGEALNPLKLKGWRNRFPETKLINMFGITETTVHVTYKEITGKEIDSGISNIGKTIPTLAAYIMDDHFELVPIGVRGELCVGGAGVSRGYLNLPELTAQKFITNPYDPDERLYRSGDLVRFLADGDMEYLGRMDQQVQLRGFRVELGEIETQLLRHDGIKEVLVLAREDKKGDKYLCAYIVGAITHIGPSADILYSNGSLKVSQLREYLSVRLPHYMIPSYFVLLNRIPLTLNGKIDRGALPDPEPTMEVSRYTAPRDEVEEKLSVIWGGILGIEKNIISTDADFFELGGHSLRAARLASKIHKELNIKVSIEDIFKTPTISGLAAAIKRATEDKYISIEPAEVKEYYTTSSAQRRLYLLQQMDEHGTGYNMPFVSILEGNVDKDRLKSTFCRLIKRHESLRTSFLLVNDEPVQRIHDNVEFEMVRGPFDQKSLNVRDPVLKSAPSPRRQDLEEIIKGFIRPFNLSQAPLLRVGLVHLPSLEQSSQGGIPGDGYLLMIDMHHIITDGTSMSVLVKDFAVLYGGGSLPVHRVQYKDFSEWQDSWKERELIKEQGEYWLKEFGDKVPVLDLPIDYSRPGVQSFAGSVLHFELAEEQTRALKSFALEEGATLFMVVLAMYTVLLSKLGSQEDIVVGIPIAGRRHTDLEPIMGMFVNSLALRNFSQGEKCFQEFLREVKSRTLEAFNNRDYPFEDLVENLEVQRDTGRSPLFDTMFSIQDMDVSMIEVPGLKILPYHFDSGISKFDLILVGAEREDRIFFSFEYCTGLFKEDTIRKFIRYFRSIVCSVLKERRIKLSRIDVLSAEEKYHLLHEFTGAEGGPPASLTLHGLFAEQEGKTPHQIAVGAWPAGRQAQDTERREQHRGGEEASQGQSPKLYELNYRELNENAGRLAHYLRRDYGIESGDLVALLVEMPAKRAVGLLAVLKAGGAYIPLDPATPPWRLDFILKDSNCRLLVTDRKEGIPMSVKTSISIVNMQTDAESIAACSEEYLESAGEPGDLACVLYESDASGFPRGLMIKHQGLVHWGTGIKQKDQWLEVLVSLVSTAAFWQEPSIYKCCILDSYRNLVPLGTAGEIYVGTGGCCRGYLNRPEFNAEKFIPNSLYWKRSAGTYWLGPSQSLVLAAPHLPTAVLSPLLDLLYRTGDWGKYLPDGRQVITRPGDNRFTRHGYFIEPGDIEYHLSAYEGIKEAVVSATAAHDEGQPITAYYVRSDAAIPLDISDYKEFLSNRLPAYMLPTDFVELENLPRDPQGRIDRSALPAPAPFVCPRNEIERKLCAIWSKIFTLEEQDISVTSDFFKLGGNSIKALVTVSEINEVFNVNLLLTDIFKNSTIEEFASYLAGLTISPETQMPTSSSILPIEEREYYGLSHSQRRLWVLSQLEESAAAYNMPGAYILAGVLNRGAFFQAIETLIGRHEILRTIFITVDGEPKQKILKKEEIGPAFAIEEIDLRKDVQRETKARDFVDRRARQVFDLRKGPLLSAALVRLADEKYLFLFNMHHIISDGWSVGVLVEEVGASYNNAIKGGESPLMPLSIQYKDFSTWQDKQLQESILQKSEYWLEKLSGEVQVLPLPCDYPRPAVKTFRGDFISFSLSSQLSREILELSRLQGTSLFMTLLASIKALLYRYTGMEDIVVGSAVSGRPHSDLDKQIGFYVNTLALRTIFTGRASFENLLAKVQETCLSAYEHDLYPFDRLVDELNLERDTSRTPLFDVMVTLAPDPRGKSRQLMSGITMEEYPVNSKISKFDLLFAFSRSPQRINVNVEYNTDIFSRQRIKWMAGHYQRLLQAIIDCSQSPLYALNYLSDEERHQLLHEFNDTKAEYPRDKVIHRIFEEQADKSPGNIAVIDMEQVVDAKQFRPYLGENMPSSHSTSDNKNMVHVTYKELNEKSNRLARFLISRGVGPECFIGIMAERSIEMIVGILGILKAGGAYLPISPNLPAVRNRFMLKDSNAKHLLLQQHSVNKNRELMASLSSLDVFSLDDPESYSHESEGIFMTAVEPCNPGYIIYTSGSTGQPKGVILEHKGIVNYVMWAAQKYIKHKVVTFPFYTSFSFDLTVTSIFTPLVTGSAILIYRGDEKEFLLKKVVEENKVDIVKLTPSHLKLVPEIITSSSNHFHQNDTVRIKQLIVGGENLDTQLARDIHQVFNGNIELHNEYGPTETVVGSMIHEFDPHTDKGEFVPIGLPIYNTQIYLLDENIKPVPIGITGEIYISGPGVARGYLNRPELTAEKFVNNPFYPGGKMYATGDLARRYPDGNIECLGRKDHQVKIRGYRVELEEIKEQLKKHEYIIDAVVVVVGTDTAEDKHLCAYFVSRSIPGAEANNDLNASELRDMLSKRLPSYMIPSYFVPLEKIPLTPSGKIDRKALALPNRKIDTRVEYALPGNKTEEELLKVWQEVLGIERIGINDNFFSLGGNSITLLKVYARIDQVYPSRVRTVDLFNYTTIAKLAKLIQKGGKDDEKEMELPGIILPGAFFNDAHKMETAVNDILTFRVKGSLFEKLKTILAARDIPFSVLLLSIYIYMFREITGNDEISLQAVVQEEDKLDSLSINLTAVESIPVLFASLTQGLKDAASKQVSINRVVQTPLNKDKSSIRTLFCVKDLLRFNGSLADIYDIVVKVDEQPNHVEFSWEYTNRLRKEKIEEMTDIYLKLLDVLSRSMAGDN